jgi:anion-transporting  ArsA/GET3 family ATPase
LAVAAARLGKRVLFCEFGARPASADYLEVSSISHDPSQPLSMELPSLWVARLDPHLALKEYFADILKVGPLVHLATENKVLARLWKIAPSVDEIVLLSSIMNYERGTHKSGLSHLDLIVVDMPATGHALSMLGVPQGILGLGRMGPLGKRCGELQDLLSDSNKTAYSIVTLPEELPVNESIQLANDLRSKLQFETSHVFINCVLPNAFEPAELELLEQLDAESQPSIQKSILGLAKDNTLLHRRQQTRMKQLKNGLNASYVEIQQFSERGRRLIQEIANHISPEPAGSEL